MKNIKVYGSKVCHKCKKIRDTLKEKGADVEYVDISTLNEKEIKEISKYGSALPILIIAASGQDALNLMGVE